MNKGYSLEKLKINSYLDFELTRKLEALVINALPEQTYMSDFNMLYIANIKIEEDEDGTKYQVSAECDDVFLMSVVNDFGNIDYRPIKTIHVADVLESDFEVTSFYPTDEDVHHYANYHSGRPIPKGGDYLEVAISPFGVTIIEMINGQEIHLYGNGRVRVEYNMIGFKGYKQVPKVQKILSNDSLKILKVAIYTRYSDQMHRRYSLNIFSPTMRIIKEPITGQFNIDEDRIQMYLRDTVHLDQDKNIDGIVEYKNNTVVPAEVTIGPKSNIYDIENTLRITKYGYIDASQFGDKLSGDFTIHFIATINEYANTGTTLMEFGYGLTQSGFQTHHFTLWVGPDGHLRYNGQYSNEWLDTGYIVKKNMENIFTVTVENQKFDIDDQDEYVTFIHVNGKQVWPDKQMYTKTEKIYIWRAMEAYRTYNEVCMMLPAPHPISGGIDAKSVCARKLLHESGFITLDNLYSVYQLYLNRPRPSKADPTGFIFGDSENTTIKKVFFGQDSEKDLFDNEYYMDGAFSEITIFQPSLGRKEIEKLHLLNILRCSSIEL